MNRLSMFALIIILAVIMLFAGCAGVKKEDIKVKAETVLVIVDQVPKTMAVLPFENNSVTDPDRYAPLSRAFRPCLLPILKTAAHRFSLLKGTRFRPC